MRKTRFFGRIKSALRSLDELAVHIHDSIQVMGSESSTSDLSVDMLFGSRGSFPFVRALSLLAKEGMIRKVNAIPHIFSFENLTEIVSGYDRLRYETYVSVFGRFFDDISFDLNKKLRLHSEGSVLTDWDEVNTGRNLSERIKLYNRLDVQTPFVVTSFIGSGAKRLDQEAIRSIKRSMRKSPDSMRFFDFIAEEAISWSDDEGFFADIGLTYPCIAAPEIHPLRLAVTPKLLPEFYAQFFRNHSEAVASQFNVSDPFYNELVVLPKHCESSQLRNPELTLQLSLIAFIDGLKKIDELNGFTGRLNLLDSRYEIDVAQGSILMIRPNGKQTSLLRLRHPKAAPYHPNYRNPFTLFYDASSSAGPVLNQVISGYLGRNGHG